MSLPGVDPKVREGYYEKLYMDSAKECKEWKRAALRLGEELASVGPNFYYDMNAKDWLKWALNNVGCGHCSCACTKCGPCGKEAEL